MNNLKGESIPEAFAGESYQVLLVAEKFQTGFDQPLLVAMYVDKKLANIAAVQTLSRLNRTYERAGIKKDATYVLDFVNKADDILKAFLPYYRVAEISGWTDPDIIHDLQNKLDNANLYTSDDVERYVAALAKAQEAGKGEMSGPVGKSPECPARSSSVDGLLGRPVRTFLWFSGRRQSGALSIFESVTRAVDGDRCCVVK